MSFSLNAEEKVKFENDVEKNKRNSKKQDRNYRKKIMKIDIEKESFVTVYSERQRE